MTVSPAFFGPTNAFTIQATSQVIGFMKEPGKYKLRDYCQFVKGTSTEEGTGKPIAAYTVLDPDAPVRIGPAVALPAGSATADIQGLGGGPDNQWRWDPAQKRPPANIAANFKFQVVQMDRRNYGYQVDTQTQDTASQNVLQIYRQIALNIAMSVKTWRVIKMLELASNWPAANTADANTLNGGKGKWDTASSDELSPNAFAIAKSVIQAVINIVLQTNGMVEPSDLVAVISPTAAFKMGTSGEIRGYVKSSAFSKERDEGKNLLNEAYGLPKYFAGIEWIVEDAVVVTEEMNAAQTPATTNRVWIKNDTSAIILSRKGGINGVQGAPTFSTVQVWFYKYEMTVEEKMDTWNKLHMGAVVDQFAEVPSALRAGYLITNIL